MNSRLHSASLDALKPSAADEVTRMGSTSYEELQNRDFEDSDILKYLARDIKRNSCDPQLYCPALPNRVISQQPPAFVMGNYGHYQKNVKLSRNTLAEGSRSHTPSPKAEAGSVESVMAENAVLKREIEGLLNKLTKMQKVELEVDNIQQLYTHLQKSTQKREALENAIRLQMEKDKQFLLQENQQLREHVDVLSRQISQRSPVVSEVDYQAAIKEFQLAISRLNAQNKELVEGRKRQDIELAAQRATLDEQRNHIGILDSYLTSAQANVAALEEELSKRSQSNDRLQEVQQALANLQLASSKREASEKRIRAQMEHEIVNLKQEIRNMSGSGQSELSRTKQETNADALKTSTTDVSASSVDVGKLQETIARLEQQLAEKNAVMNRYFRNPQKLTGHVRELSEATKDSVSGNSASTADLHASSSQLSVQRPKSAASSRIEPRIEPKSQLWEV